MKNDCMCKILKPQNEEGIRKREMIACDQALAFITLHAKYYLICGISGEHFNFWLISKCFISRL